MTLRQYLLAMIVGSAVTLAAVALILVFVDPDQGGPAAVIALVAAVGLGVTGTLAVLGVVARVYLFRRPGLVTDHVRVSFRQGVAVALLMILALILTRYRIFAWWNMLLAVALAAMIEYIFASADARDFETAPEERDQA
jgi:hypothetical protein